MWRTGWRLGPHPQHEAAPKNPTETIRNSDRDSIHPMEPISDQACFETPNMQPILIWKITALFSLGLVVGMVCLNIWGGDPAPTDAPDEQKAPVNLSQTPFRTILVPPSGETPRRESTAETEHAGELLTRGDLYLVGGNYALALDNYRAFIKFTGAEHASLLLREAFCYERQGNLRSAENAYRVAVSQAATHNQQLIAIAGYSRALAAQNRTDEAVDILGEQSLKIDQNTQIPAGTRAQITYQYAKALEAKALKRAVPRPDANADHTQNASARMDRSSTTRDDDSPRDLTHPLALATENSLPNPESYLEIVDQLAQGESTVDPEENPWEFNILQRPSDSAKSITLSITTGLRPVPNLMGEVLALTDLELRFSNIAQATITGRSRSVALQSTTLSSLLDHLLVSFDLAWYQTDTTIHVVAKSELPDVQSIQAFEFEVAERAFRRFEIDYSDNPLRNAALLSRAGLALATSDYNKASNLYQELQQTQPTDEIQAKSFFNQGKLNLLLGRPVEAAEFFYLAIDQTLNANLESSSYCLLSRLHLSMGQVDHAIKAGRRGLATAETVKQREMAAVNLARSYLLNKDPFSANRTLFQNHDFIKDPDQRAVSAILGAFARSIGISDRGGVEKANNRLLSAMSMMKDEQYDSFADCYVASMAYENIGFRNRAIRMLLLALTKPDIGAWQRRVLFELGMLQKDAGHFEDAITTFESLTRQSDQWCTNALQQIAGIYSTTNQADQTIVACKRLWQRELNEPQKNRTLQLLGNAFQRKGEHHAAALCYAGMLPEQF